MPWEGGVLVGNTDLDHDKDLASEVCITPEEVDYLLEFVQYQFPSLDIKREDILSTWSGVRPVIGTGVKDPSKEKRDYGIWNEQGLISVSGGKLTTFRLTALEVLHHAASSISEPEIRDTRELTFRRAEKGDLDLGDLDASSRRRLAGRYGAEVKEVITCAGDDELTRIPGTNTLWVELRYAARNEGVVHLEDLFLRRTRLGVVLQQGGVAFLDRIKEICQEELGWDDQHWEQEAENYKALRQRCHSVP
jgi:glycerol-3-phosphate dehydrogenase